MRNCMMQFVYPRQSNYYAKVCDMIDINVIIDKLQKKFAKDMRFISNSELKQFIEEKALDNDTEILSGLKTHYRNTLRSYRKVLDTIPGMNAARECDECAEWEYDPRYRCFSAEKNLPGTRACPAGPPG